MTDKQFRDEIRRGVLTIMRAIIAQYGMSWDDFRPREENRIIRAPEENQSATPLAVAKENSHS